MAFITPNGWESFQHYKDRKPAWIKLHRDLLDNYDFHCLPVASRALAPCLWLLASEYEGGAVPADMALIAFRLRMSASEVEAAITPLIEKGFFVASVPLAQCKHSACLETETETEREIDTRAPRSSPGKTKHPAGEYQIAPAAKGSRLPPDWTIPPDWIPDAEQIGLPAGAIPTEAAKFRDYWSAKSGKDATKTDWRATWRNWCRNATERLQRPTGKPSKHDLTRMNYTAGVSPDGTF
jgi:hypothetical protein